MKDIETYIKSNFMLVQVCNLNQTFEAGYKPAPAQVFSETEGVGRD